jgi:hypothetical protein
MTIATEAAIVTCEKSCVLEDPPNVGHELTPATTFVLGDWPRVHAPRPL